MMKKLLLILLCLPMIGFGQDIGYHISYNGDIHKTTDSGINWILQGQFKEISLGAGYTFVEPAIGNLEMRFIKLLILELIGLFKILCLHHTTDSWNLLIIVLLFILKIV